MRRTRSMFLPYGSFTPASLFVGAPAGAWYDPSDLSTLYQSGTRSSRGPAVAADGDPVGLLLDKSGNANDLAQATSTKCPLYKIDGNGQPYLLFDGVDDFLALASFSISLPYDRISAIQQVVWTGNRLLWGSSVGTVGYLVQNPSTPSVRLESGAGTNVLSNAGAAVGANAVIVERHVANASQLGVNNGALVGPTDVGALAPAVLVLGATTTAGSTPSNIRFYGAIIRAGSLGASDLAGSKTWLGAKAGLSL